MLTADYEFEHRTILYKDNITRAEIQAVVRQRYTMISRRARTKNLNVGQALVANKPARRSRKQGSGNGVADKSVTGGVAVGKNDNSSSTKDGRGSSTTCVTSVIIAWSQDIECYTAHVIPGAKKSPNGSGEITGCLVIGMLCKRDAVGERAQSTDGTEKRIADRGATFHMTRSADLLHDLHPSEDEVKIDNDTLIGVEGYGSLTVVFSNKEGRITVRLEKVAYVPDLAFSLFSLLVANTRGVGFATDDEDMSMTLVDGRQRFWSDGSGYSKYGRRIDPDDDYIPFPLSMPEPIESPVQPAVPAPLWFPVITAGSDDSYENEWFNSLTLLPENPAQFAHPVPWRSLSYLPVVLTRVKPL